MSIVTTTMHMHTINIHVQLLSSNLMAEAIVALGRGILLVASKAIYLLQVLPYFIIHVLTIWLFRVNMYVLTMSAPK